MFGNWLFDFLDTLEAFFLWLPVHCSWSLQRVASPTCCFCCLNVKDSFPKRIPTQKNKENN
jgi:hypothetical protein